MHIEELKRQYNKLVIKYRLMINSRNRYEKQVDELQEQIKELKEQIKSLKGE